MKGVLIVDIPDDGYCDRCKMFVYDYDYKSGICAAGGDIQQPEVGGCFDDFVIHFPRPKGCPLEDMPEEIHATDNHEYYNSREELDLRSAYCDGWNDYRREITGD